MLVRLGEAITPARGFAGRNPWAPSPTSLATGEGETLVRLGEGELGGGGDALGGGG